MIPAWIADMDFEAPPCVVAALKERAAHSVYGYPTQRRALVSSIVTHMRERHGWCVQDDAIVLMTSCVAGLYAAVRCSSAPGDAVVTTIFLIAIPAYV